MDKKLEPQTSHEIQYTNPHAGAEVSPVARSVKKKWVGVGIVVILLGLLGVYFLVSKQESGRSTTTQATGRLLDSSILADSDASSMPFAELTIPYLRERSYSSKLNELVSLSNNGTYTSYLTSYDSDGFKINGLLTRPTGEEPVGGFPAIVFIHGYIPPTQYVTTEKYVDYVDFLARNGFVVFKIDLRGHGDSEGEPGGGYYGSDYVVDALNAKAALSSSEFVKNSAIGFWGHSMAGNTVMRVMAASPETPAGVIWAGAVYTYLDMQKYRINDNSYQPPTNDTARQQKRRELFEQYGSPSAESKFWQEVAPTNYLDDLKGAVSIHHAVNDDVVDIGYSRDLKELLDRDGVVNEFTEYASGGHNIIGASFNTAMQKSVDFYKKYLK